jgi:hypothetical protein
MQNIYLNIHVKAQRWFFEKNSMIDNTLTRLIREKEMNY